MLSGAALLLTHAIVLVVGVWVVNKTPLPNDRLGAYMTSGASLGLAFFVLWYLNQQAALIGTDNLTDLFTGPYEPWHHLALIGLILLLYMAFKAFPKPAPKPSAADDPLNIRDKFRQP
jgi:hypothetical protein